MPYTASDGRRYGRARSQGDREADRRLADLELGILDPVLHWRQVNTLVYGEERNHDAFARLTEGVRSGRRTITLATVARPGGRRALKSQVLLFLQQFEEADAAGRVEGEPRQLRLVGATDRTDGVGLHLDVRA